MRGQEILLYAVHCEDDFFRVAGECHGTGQVAEF